MKTAKNSTTLNVLSIDYDYFMKFKDDDISVLSSFPDGTEAFINLSDIIWTTRLASDYDADNIAKVSCNTDELFEVWKFLSKQRKSTPVLIVNSHVHIYEFVKEHMKNKDSVRVVNMDFHHDAYDIYEKNKGVNCGNWVNFLDREYSMEYDWITSDCGWKAASEKPAILDGRPRYRNLEDFRIANPKFRPDIIFICRSDCWTPPHMDRCFVNLAFDVCGRFSNIMGDGRVLKTRNLDSLVKQQREIYAKMHEQYRKANNISL